MIFIGGSNFVVGEFLEKIWRFLNKSYICTTLIEETTIKRVLSSVGSEHLVYTQRVGGSNPSGPTEKETKSFQKNSGS